MLPDFSHLGPTMAGWRYFLGALQHLARLKMNEDGEIGQTLSEQSSALLITVDALSEPNDTAH